MKISCRNPVLNNTLLKPSLLCNAVVFNDNNDHLSMHVLKWKCSNYAIPLFSHFLSDKVQITGIKFVNKYVTQVLVSIILIVSFTVDVSNIRVRQYTYLE